MSEYPPSISAMTAERDYPTAAIQYAVALPDGTRIAYGDQSYVRWGEVLKDHPDGRIEQRTVTIAYGEWEDVTP